MCKRREKAGVRQNRTPAYQGLRFLNLWVAHTSPFMYAPFAICRADDIESTVVATHRSASLPSAMNQELPKNSGRNFAWIFRSGASTVMASQKTRTTTSVVRATSWSGFGAPEGRNNVAHGDSRGETGVKVLRQPRQGRHSRDGSVATTVAQAFRVLDCPHGWARRGPQSITPGGA